jgi:hypothetical protein
MHAYKLHTTFVLAGVLGMVLSTVPAYADDQTQVNLTVNAGALTITAPSTPLNLTALTCSSTLQTPPTNDQTGTITITDTTGSFAGWTAKYSFRNLRGVTDNTKFVRLASESPITTNTVKYLKTTPSNLTAGPNSDPNFTDVGGIEQTISSLSGLTETGESNDFNWAQADAGHGAGTFTGTIGVKLSIPPFCRYPDNAQILPQNYTNTAGLKLKIS